MQHSINDINLLPTSTQLRKISQSLAMLDAIIMPEWSDRYFSFNAHWDDRKDEMMASMKTASGDEYYILFRPRNALGKVYSSSDKQMSKSEIDKLEDMVPYILSGFMDEEAFDADNASFFFWISRTDKEWKCTKKDGNLDYLNFFVGGATLYKEWAEEYYEKSIDLNVVKKIMKFSPLTSAMVEKLNPQITLKELAEDIDEIGYPLWKKKGKRKTLPNDFEELLKEGDIEKLKKVFDVCELDAYGGGSYWKQVTIAYALCPDELVKWLVAKGADLNKEDYYGQTPLQQRSARWEGSIKVLLELGADVNCSDSSSNTPLHNAAQSCNNTNIELLLEYGADINAKNLDILTSLSLTPLEYALQRSSNANLESMLKTSQVLLKHGAKITPKMKKYITKIGEVFEFHRDAYNKESVGSADKALSGLYELFDVEPVEKRVIHDGKSEIIITQKGCKKQFDELWEMLIPSSGYASTVQGEVIRIAGRIADEVDRNGGGNWDNEYRKMSKVFLELIATGNPLSDDEISKLKSILAGLGSLYDETDVLIEYAVKWVKQNRMPLPMSKPDYDR